MGDQRGKVIKVFKKDEGGGILSLGMMGDQRGKVIKVFKRDEGGGDFELGDDGRSEGNGDPSL